MKKNFKSLTFALSIFFCSYEINAAKLICYFSGGETFIKDTGEWKGHIDADSIWNLFGDSIEFDLTEELEKKLDEMIIFVIGKTKKGDLYVVASEFGAIEGRVTSVEKDNINIYISGCDIRFGN